MGTWSIWHWLVVLAVVLVVFGTKKLRNLGSDLGGAVKGFREAMHDGKDGQSAEPARLEEDGKPIDGSTNRASHDERPKTPV